MVFQKTVLIVVWGKHQVGGAFDNRIIRRVELDRGISEITAPKLRATYGDFTILAVSDEYRSFDWAYEELGILASVDLNLRSVIKEIYLAVIEVLDHEVYAIDVSGHLHEFLVTQAFEHEVGLIQLLFLRRWRNFRLLLFGLDHRHDVLLKRWLTLLNHPSFEVG